MYAIVGMTTTEKPEEGKTIQVLRYGNSCDS